MAITSKRDQGAVSSADPIDSKTMIMPKRRKERGFKLDSGGEESLINVVVRCRG